MITAFPCINKLISEQYEDEGHIKLLQDIETTEPKGKSLKSVKIECDKEPKCQCKPPPEHPVYHQRYQKVLETLRDERWRKEVNSLIDFGCSKFGIFPYLRKLISLHTITFVDIDACMLESYKSYVSPQVVSDYPLKLRQYPLTVNIAAGNVVDPECTLKGVDAITAIELIEHLYPDELEAFPYNIFSYFQPKIVIVTTPNADFNSVFPDGLKRLRHDDHKFEWSREQFEDWATNITARFPNYTVSFTGVGEAPYGREHLGYCSQVAIFISTHLIDKQTFPYNPTCQCSPNISCRENKNSTRRLWCHCICSECVPDFSYGICTHCRYSEEKASPRRDSVHSYDFLCCVKHEVAEPDHDEDEQLIKYIRDIIADFVYQVSYFDKKEDRFQIPLWQIIQNGSGYITQKELHQILLRYRYKIEDCVNMFTGDIESCLIYDKVSDEEYHLYDLPNIYDGRRERHRQRRKFSSESDSEYSSSEEESMELYPYDEDYDNYYQLNEAPSSNGDEVYDNNEVKFFGYGPVCTKDTEFPKWLLQMLDTFEVDNNSGDINESFTTEVHDEAEQNILFV